MKFKEKSISVKNVYKWARLFKEGQNSIQDEDRHGRLTIVSIPEIVESVNALILANRRVIITFLSSWTFLWVQHKKFVHDDLCLF